jgi:hypothetical protein
MESKRRILVIENQYTQFDDITTLLDNFGYDHFPNDKQTFKTFIDWIRIYLNPRYDIDRRNSIWSNILEKTKEYDPELILIDHILVGSHTAENGIHLAVKFRNCGITTPFLFLSRTDINNIDVCEKITTVSLEKDWIGKGYSGADILEDAFFKEMVIPKIEALLKKSISTRIIEKLNEKKPKIISTTESTERNIVAKTIALINNIKEGKIDVNDELLSQLSENLTDSKYLELLISKESVNE